MALAHTKLCQHFIDAAAAEIVILRASAARLDAIQKKFQQVAPNVTGTSLDKQTTAVGNWINTVQQSVNSLVADKLLEGKSLRHRAATALTKEE